MQSLTTLEQFIIQREKHFPEASGAFSQLLRDLVLAVKCVQREVARAGLGDILGQTGTLNIQGETVQKLDVFAHQQMIAFFTMRGQIAGIASEEEEQFIPVNIKTGNYILLMDPLDGSSNIDVCVPVGTIFSIYKRISQPGEPLTEADFLQSGQQQLAAGYVIYGSSTILVYTTGLGVNGFTLEPSIGEFFLSHPEIRIPSTLACYSINECKVDEFAPGVKKYLEDVKTTSAHRDRVAATRYIGSMVADIHRNLIKGGMFLYPASSSAPKGKLRLLYEANPMAWLMEQAGGKSSYGSGSVLEIKPEELHQRTPLFLGPAHEIERLENYLGE